jgi:hypothetical protein
MKDKHHHHKKKHKKKHKSDESNDDPSHLPGKRWKTEPDADGHHTHTSRRKAQAKAARAAIVASQRDNLAVKEHVSALRNQAISFNSRRFANKEKAVRKKAPGPRPSDLPPRLKLGFRYDEQVPVSLFDAVCRGEFDVIKTKITSKTSDLEKNGLEINRCQGHYPRCTLLHLACKFSTENIVKYMLENGGDVNIQDDIGRTPLMIATRRGDIKIVKLLLTYDVKEKKKQLQARNQDNLTAIQLAIQYGEEKIRSFFINHLKVENMKLSSEDRAIAVSLAAHEKEKRSLVPVV